MGLGVILPLLLILNLGMSPGVAGLGLLLASLPLIAIAPLVGRWYDRAGARPPTTSGYALLAIGGVLLAIGGFQFNYWFVLPGLLAYGAGLAVVLTVNDPVSLSDVPDADHGQAAGVSATAEQFGGSLGIAVLYLIFHTTYVAQLHAIIDRGPPRRSGRRPVRPTPRRSCRRRKHRLETQAVRSAAQPLPGRRRYRSGLGIRRRVPRRHAARHRRRHPRRRKLKIEKQSGLGFRVIRQQPVLQAHEPPRQRSPHPARWYASWSWQDAAQPGRHRAWYPHTPGHPPAAPHPDVG